MSSKTVAVAIKDRTLRESSVTNVIKPGDSSKSQDNSIPSGTKSVDGTSATKSKKMSILGFGSKISITPSKSRASTLVPAAPAVLSASKAPIASKIGPGWNTSTKPEGFLDLTAKVSYKAPAPRVKSLRTDPVTPSAKMDPDENSFLSNIDLTPPSSPVATAPSVGQETPEKESSKENTAPVAPVTTSVAPLSAKKTPRRGSTFEEKLKEIQAIEETWMDVPSPMPGDSSAPAVEVPKLDPFNYEPSDDEEEEEECEELQPDHENDHSENEEEEAENQSVAAAGDVSMDATEVSLTDISVTAPSVTATSAAPTPVKTPIKSPVKARRPTVKPSTATASSTYSTPVPKHMKAPTPHFKKGTPSKEGSVSTTAAIAPSLFKNGVTLGEEMAAQERSLRIYNDKASTGVKPKRKLNGGVQSKVDSLSPIFSRAGRGDHDGLGRPSIGTMTTQWEFMRTNFLNNSEEDLEWLMVSKKGGAYKFAHKKNCASEDKYFKSMHDIQKYEEKLEMLSGGGAKLPQGIAEIAEKCRGLGNTMDPKLLEKLTAIHESLVKYCAATPAAVAAFSTKTEAAIQSLLEETDKQKVYRKARELNDKVIAEVKQMQASLVQSRKDQDEALVNMEKWAKREKETNDYAAEMRIEEEAWMEKEREANLAALRTMRQFIPVNIAELSVNDLLSMAKDEGGLMSLELATEIKNNRLLHWLVLHTDDIAVSNFLSGDKKAYFENLEAYDVIELRALAVCVPLRFELDNDGKKTEWRGRLITRVKQLVSQFNGDKVKGMWDDVLHRRSMVELPQLKPEQLRRLVYYYRTKEQSDVRLKQYDDKQALLTKKEAMLTQAETEAADAKREYDVVLKEMRDPDFLEEYGAEKLAEVKDVAKREWTSADKKLKTLTQDVNRLRKTIADAPITRDQFYNMDKELERHLKFKMDYNWSEKGQAAVQIEGVFDGEPEITKVERQAAKCISAEQEAAQRKAELSSLKPTAATPADDVPSRAVTPVDSAVNKFASLENNAAQYSAACESGNSAVFSSPKPMKRNSVINANPELANTLNKMFSSAASTTGGTAMGGIPGSANKSFRRNSTMTTAVSTPGKEGDAEVVKEKKVSQSKLLMKLMAPKEEVAPKRPPMFGGGGGGGMSFLEELKAKKEATSNNSSGGGEGATASAPKSFLDQLKGFGKSKSEPQDSACAVMEELSETVAITPAPKKKAIGSGMPNLGFLDMIKARRID